MSTNDIWTTDLKKAAAKKSSHRRAEYSKQSLSRYISKSEVHSEVTVSQAMEASYSSLNLYLKDEFVERRAGHKPWQKREKEKKTAQKSVKPALRQKLLTIRACDKTFEYTPDVSRKIELRIEKYMNSNRLKVFDHRYMESLSNAVSQFDQEVYEKRTTEREKVEIQRCRQLVIDGIVEPGPGDKDLLEHPLLRCRRVMRRVNKSIVPTVANMGHVRMTPVLKVPKIHQIEPFDEYERNGILFPEHKHHYLRSKRVIGSESPNPYSPDISPDPSTFRLPSFLSGQTSRAFDSENLYSTIHSMTGQLSGKAAPRRKKKITGVYSAIKILPGTIAPPPQDEGKEIGSVPGSLYPSTIAITVKEEEDEHQESIQLPTDIIDDKDRKVSYMEQVPKSPQWHSQSSSHSDESVEMVYEPSRRKMKKEIMSSGIIGSGIPKKKNPSLSRYFEQFPAGHLEKLYSIVRSQLLDEVLNDDKMTVESMFSAGTSVIDAYKRENAKSRQFCSKLHRKLFD